MARVTLRELQAWAEKTKLTLKLDEHNSDLLTQIEEEVLLRIDSSAYDTSGWTNESTTPRIVRVAIAKMFVAWAYRRQYSEDISDNDASYAAQLEANANVIINGIVDGTIEIPTEPASNAGSPTFYPTDDSSAMEPTEDDRSLGDAKFSMNLVF